MRFPMVWRKTAADEIQYWKDEAGRQRRRARKAEEDLKTEVAARRRATDMSTDLHDKHERLRAQPAVVDAAKARQMAGRIADLQKAVAEGREEAAAARAEARRQRRRGDHLQKQLDDALGMPPGGILDSSRWQPGYVEPTPDKAVSS